MEIGNTRLLEALKYAFGDIINKHLEDPDIIEIMLNPDKKLWIEKLKTGIEDTGCIIEPELSISIINTIAHHAKDTVTTKNPIISAELPDTGFRFEGLIPPVVKNPTFTIRKKALLIFSLDDYVEMECLSLRQCEVIKQAIKDKKNILVVGGTSTGKTTFTNACIAEIQKEDRLVIIEDTEELQSKCPNTVFLRTNEFANMTNCLISTMRLRPERIIVGEVRGKEALDLLTAWNSGHSGGFSTIHSDSADGGLKQLEQYIQRVSVDKQRELIGKAVNLIIVLQRVENKRKVISITEIDYKENYILKEVL